MDRSVSRRTAAITIVSALLLAWLSSMAVSQVFSLAPMSGVGSTADNAAFCAGDCQLDFPGQPDTTGASTFSTSTATYTFPEVHGSDEASSTRRMGRPARPGSGAGDIEYSPGEEPSALPAPASEREVAPEVGKQP